MAPKNDARLERVEIPASQSTALNSFEPLVDKLASYGVVFMLCLCLLIYLSTALIREAKKQPRARRN
jgi:hypothetical protein